MVSLERMARCLEEDHVSTSAAMDSLRNLWFPRIQRTDRYWKPPYPAQSPGLRSCFRALAREKDSRVLEEGFWKELQGVLPPFEFSWLCDDGRCDCWKAADRRHTWVNFKRGRQLRREIWHELGRIASRPSLSSEAFRQTFVQHAKGELRPVSIYDRTNRSVSQTVSIRHLRLITGNPALTDKDLSFLP